MSNTAVLDTTPISGNASDAPKSRFPSWVKVGAPLVEFWGIYNDGYGDVYPAVIESIDGDIITVWSPHGFFMVNRKNVATNVIHKSLSAAINHSQHKRFECWVPKHSLIESLLSQGRHLGLRPFSHSDVTITTKWLQDLDNRFGRPAHSIDCATATIAFGDAESRFESAAIISQELKAAYDKSFAIGDEAVRFSNRAALEAKRALVANPGHTALEWKSELDSAKVQCAAARANLEQAVEKCPCREHHIIESAWWNSLVDGRSNKTITGIKKLIHKLLH